MKATWEKVCNAIADDIVARLDKMTDRELGRFERGMKRSGPTSTNCVWITYGLAPTVLEIVKNLRRLRRHQARAMTENSRKTANLVRDIIKDAQSS